MRMTDDRVAIFIAGDHNIIFPSVVALESIREKNRFPFDPYICVNINTLSENDLSLCRRYGISLIDTTVLDRKYDYISQFTQKKMHEGAWPVDVFYNYIIPVYLHELGYRYSVKCDYDILCINSWNLDDILPSQDTDSVSYMAVSNLHSTMKQGRISDGLCSKLRSEITLDPVKCLIPSAGFIVFNNSNYVLHKLHEGFSEIYSYMYADSPKINALEQVALGVLFAKNPELSKIISPAYNYRTIWLHPKEPRLCEVKNLHYNSDQKPWRPVSSEAIKLRASSPLQYMASFFCFHNIWIDFACQIKGFEQYYPQICPLSQEYIIDLTVDMERVYKDNIRNMGQLPSGLYYTFLNAIAMHGSAELSSLLEDFRIVNNYIQFYIGKMPHALHFEIIEQAVNNYTVALHLENPALITENWRIIFKRVQQSLPDYQYDDSYGPRKLLVLNKNTIKLQDVIPELLLLHRTAMPLINMETGNA